MVLKTIQGGKSWTARFAPANLPPSGASSFAQRMPDSVGLVIERKRLPHEKDGLQWYCDNCTSLLYEEFFTLQNVEKDFPPIFDRFFADEKNRTCKKCGAVMPKPPSPGA